MQINFDHYVSFFIPIKNQKGLLTIGEVKKAEGNQIVVSAPNDMRIALHQESGNTLYSFFLGTESANWTELDEFEQKSTDSILKQFIQQYKEKLGDEWKG